MQLPNALTAGRFLLAGMGAVALLIPFPLHYTLAALVFVAASISDGLDGYLARTWKMTSALGAFMDPLADKVIVLIYLAHFTIMQAYPEWLLLAFIARELLHDGFRSYAANKHIVVGANTASKVKTTLQMIALIITLCLAAATEFTYASIPLFREGTLLAQVMMAGALVAGIVGTAQFLRHYAFLLLSGE